MLKTIRPRVGPKGGANNPVARALARQKLQRSMLNVKISLFMTDEGEQIQSMVQEVSRLIVVTLLSCKIDNVEDHVSVMDEALRVLCKIAENDFKWHRPDVWIVEWAMDEVLLSTPKLSTIAIQEATKEIHRLELLEKQNAATNPA